MIIFLSILLTAGQIASMDIREEEELRNSIYNKKPEIDGVKGFGLMSANFIIVPNEIKALFKKKPSQTLMTLVSIVEGANPKESCLAAAYAVTLLENDGFGGFMIYNDLFRESEYDKLKPNDRRTWRKHWVNLIKNEASKKGFDLKPKGPEK